MKRDEVKVVNLQRGTQRQSYNCTPQCNPSITIGDEQKLLRRDPKASQNKIGFSERAADQSGQQRQANSGWFHQPNRPARLLLYASAVGALAIIASKFTKIPTR